MDKRLRILQIFNRYLNYGGEEGSVYRIGDALQKLHDVEYLLYSTNQVLGKNRPGLKALKSVFHNSEVVQTLRRYQQVGQFDVWQVHNVFPAMSPAVYREAFRQGIQVVQYLHNYRMSCVNGLLLNHGEDCRRCIQGNFWAAAQTACWHDSHLKSGLMGLVLVTIRQMKLFEKIAHWIAISESQKKIHVQIGIPEDRITVVHHFLEPKGPPASMERARDLLYIGRLSREKGVHVILEAWAKLKAGRARLRIVGDGPERKELEEKVLNEGIPGVVFEGFKKESEMGGIWEEAICILVPSVWEEPFGMTVLEAWARGRAVMGSRSGALPELIREGDTGWLLNPGDAGDWALGMERVLLDPQRALRMGLNGRNCLEKQFNQADWLEKMKTVYHHLDFQPAKTQAE